MKIIQYNILEGGQEDSVRLNALLKWIKEQDADVVTLNELNGWESDMASYAREAGYKYSTLHETQGCSYHVGVMTRRPHDILIRENHPFHFGLLGIVCEGITFLITHLMPQSSEYRLGETRRICQIIENIPGPVLLVGDLNTLTPLDSKEMEQPQVLQILRSTPKLRLKFLDNNGQIDYAPMETLLAAGLTDLGAGQLERHTVPTLLNKDSAHALPMRIDYMMANESLINTWNYETRVIRTPETDMLSDHYPLMCELTPKKKEYKMKSKLYTWGTGAAWGRDLGCMPTDRKARNHTSASIILGTGEKQTHLLIDAGVPCVESMIDAVQDGGIPIPPPQAVFITHPHYDHHGDLTKLVFSRENGWIRNHSYWRLTEEFFNDHRDELSEKAISSLQEMKTTEYQQLRQAVKDYTDSCDGRWKKSYVSFNKVYPPTLPIIATNDCINALRPQLGFVDDKLSWQPVPELDTWYGISKENGTLVPWSQVCDKAPESIHPILFKSLPVWHNSTAHGSCLYIFRILDTSQTDMNNEKRVIITGDFASMDESVIQNEDMKNPDLLLIETNTAYTGEESTHTNWVKNKDLISKWFSKEHKAKVLLYHLSSSYDWMDGCVPRPMTDTDWRELCQDDDFKDYCLNIDIAEDGAQYEI